MKKSVVVGIIQDSPEYLDLQKSMEKADTLVRNAASKGAELIVFGETWLSGYPAKRPASSAGSPKN
jgi:predicted amidohydrolase